ncbi:hypothetical protein MRB53_039742 [Persea americana]|nr:hypothetical protein MRB53_039742 [Persea americana]
MLCSSARNCFALKHSHLRPCFPATQDFPLVDRVKISRSDRRNVSLILVDADQRHTLLISRLACLMRVRNTGLGYRGPLNRQLFAYNSVVSVVQSSLRDLLEMCLVNMLVKGHADRNAVDLTDVSQSRGFRRHHCAAQARASARSVQEIHESHGRCPGRSGPRVRAMGCCKSSFALALGVADQSDVHGRQDCRREQISRGGANQGVGRSKLVAEREALRFEFAPFRLLKFVELRINTARHCQARKKWAQQSGSAESSKLSRWSCRAPHVSRQSLSTMRMVRSRMLRVVRRRRRRIKQHCKGQSSRKLESIQHEC